MISYIRKWARNNDSIRKFIAYTLAPSGLFDGTISKMEIHPHFKRRIQDVIDCPDNARIPRVENAGQIIKGKQVMHNGLKINVGSYYGPEVAQQLILNKGVHEPQEEFVFNEVLNHINPGGTMIELGSFWAFYSMWFNTVVPNAKNYMVEPDSFNITSGIKNFALNNLKGDFNLAFVGDKMDKASTPRIICVDGLCKEKNIDFIDMLHCDIQGYEHDMLIGAKNMVQNHKVGYIFISTHTNELHKQCIDHLLAAGYLILASSDLDQTYADDGLIVAKSKQYPGPTKVKISNKTT